MSLRVSVVVLNFNGEAHLETCLDSLTHQSHVPLEVVVADNGSRDGSAALVSRYHARWLPLGRNHGFAVGCNLAAAACGGDVVVFVNNDMRFRSDFVEALVAPLVAFSDVFATDARQFDWTGGREIHLATRLVRRRGLLPTLDVQQERAQEVRDVFQACAANMAVRRSMFEGLGGFDERLPAGWEDTEICWRARLRGWRTVFVPTAVCWHKVGATSVTVEGAVVRYRGSLGGRLLFAAKHLPLEDAAMAWLLSAGASVRDVMLGRWAAARRRLGVLVEFGMYLPAIAWERHRLYRQAGTSPRRHLNALLASQ